MPPKPTSASAELADDNQMVTARWVDVQAVLVPDQGIVRYGDPITVSAEQLASPQHTTIAWSDDWTPDPTLLAQATLEG